MEPRLRELLPGHCELSYVGRDEAASPATGLHHIHEAEEKALIDGALDVEQDAADAEKTLVRSQAG
jgi:2-oxoglutarate dehydrogenase E1 component